MLILKQLKGKEIKNKKMDSKRILEEQNSF